MSCTVEILTHEEIRAGDWVRQLNLSYEGQSDYLATNSTYGGSRINRLGWMRADEVCPGWVGKSVVEFGKAMKEIGLRYEFVRGAVPATHVERNP